MFARYMAAQGCTDEQLRAAEHIDSLTLNRITDFDRLTEVQRRLILRAHERLTRFESEYSELLGCGLRSYSLNGVSMSFDGGVTTVAGITVPNEVWSLLVQTGLCYPAI